MARQGTARAKIEFGDFQTPPELAADVCRLLAKRGQHPGAIVEPTCGIGNFAFSALDAFPKARSALVVEVNDAYVRTVRNRLRSRPDRDKVRVKRASFFDLQWQTELETLAEPILVVGNPPWVTSSDLGYLKSHNIPEKMNFQGRSGMEALTGKSNFDLSEWMMIKLLEGLEGRRATIAMLCKTSVARRTLSHVWGIGTRVEKAAVYRIDTGKHFRAAVDACLFVCSTTDSAATASQVCSVFERLEQTSSSREIGFRNGTVVADAASHDRWQHLRGTSQYKWRSGVKHDCAGVMELRREGHRLMNREGDVDIEDDLLFPMLKSSDLARDRAVVPRRWMLVTQRHVGDDTSPIQTTAPKTWRYLTSNRASLNARGSSIYKGKPLYSVFGVGDYTFAPWKVAIAALYKRFDFKVVGEFESKPIVFDDTCYFAACETEAEARLLWRLITSDAAQSFFGAFVFWDSKRPITTELLQRLDLRAVARETGLLSDFDRLCNQPRGDERTQRRPKSRPEQSRLPNI